MSIEVHVTSSTMEHVTQSNLSLCSHAIVTSIWLSTNWLLFPLEEEMPLCQHGWAHCHRTGVHPQVTPGRWHRLASLLFSEGNLNIFQYSL